MSRTVASDPTRAKSGRFPNGNPTTPIRNRISPVMARVKALLPDAKASHHLAILIDEPLGNCQKLLSGHRTENADVLAKLLRSEFGREVLFALMGDARPDWFSKYQKQLDLNASRKKLIEAQRAIDALQEGLVE